MYINTYKMQSLPCSRGGFALFSLLEFSAAWGIGLIIVGDLGVCVSCSLSKTSTVSFEKLREKLVDQKPL